MIALVHKLKGTGVVVRIDERRIDYPMKESYVGYLYTM